MAGVAGLVSPLRTSVRGFRFKISLNLNIFKYAFLGPQPGGMQTLHQWESPTAN